MRRYVGRSKGGSQLVTQRRTRSAVRARSRVLLVALVLAGIVLGLTATADAWQFTTNVKVAADPTNGQVDSSSLSPCSSTNTNACLTYQYDWPRATDPAHANDSNSCDGNMVPELSAHAFTDD